MALPWSINFYSSIVNKVRSWTLRADDNKAGLLQQRGHIGPPAGGVEVNSSGRRTHELAAIPLVNVSGLLGRAFAALPSWQHGRVAAGEAVPRVSRGLRWAASNQRHRIAVSLSTHYKLFTFTRCVLK